MRSFLNYSKNRFLYGLLKFGILFLLGYLGFSYFCCIDVYASENIVPLNTKLYWKAKNVVTQVEETSSYNYSPGSWSPFGTNDVSFNLLDLGSFLEYSQRSGSYSAKITFNIKTSSETFNVEKLNCSVWSSDISNSSCNIERTSYENGVWSYVVNYRWTNNSGYIQLLLHFDSSGLFPNSTEFLYQINSFIYEPSDSSIIIDQNETIINQNKEQLEEQEKTNEKLDDLKENQDKNTDKEIESQRVCISINKSDIKNNNKHLHSNGQEANASSQWGTTDFIQLKSAKIKVIKKYSFASSGTYSCFYDSNKDKISCYSNSDLINGQVLTVPENAKYFKATINNQTNEPIFELCQDGNQAITDSQEAIKDAITDETPPNLSGLEDSAGWLPAGPVDSILNLPISLLNNLIDNLGGTCQPAILTIPFINKEITLPCMSEIYEKIGISAWINTIGTLASAFIAYYYLLELYKWVDNVLTMRENQWNDVDQWGGI